MSYMQMRLELDGRDECRPFEAGFAAPLLPVCGQFVAGPVVAAGIGARGTLVEGADVGF